MEHNLRGVLPSPAIPDGHIRRALERSVRVLNVKTKGPPCTTRGSGIVASTGLVITNWHVIEDEGPITVNDHPAEVLHFDIAYDLAALRTTTRRIGRIEVEKKLYKSMPVFYIGNPDEKNRTYADGRVMHHGKTEIRASTPPGEGFSGSGLYSSETGKLVGLVDSMTMFGENTSTTIALPAQIVDAFIQEALVRRGSVR